MEIASWRELDLVMMPWFSWLVFFTGVAPVVALVAGTLGRGAAGVLVLTAVISFVTYEGMHALYHLPVPVLRGWACSTAACSGSSTTTTGITTA